MFDMMKMMGKIKEAQQKIKETQENLAKLEVEGESGAGLVKAKVNGAKKVVSLTIDDTLIVQDQKDVMCDLVVAAINNGLTKADELAKEEMRKNTDGLLPNIPGLDLSSMMP